MTEHEIATTPAYPANANDANTKVLNYPYMLTVSQRKDYVS